MKRRGPKLTEQQASELRIASLAATLIFYRGYSDKELSAEIVTRQTVLEAGFLSRREAQEFEARIRQMRLALDTRNMEIPA